MLSPDIVAPQPAAPELATADSLDLKAHIEPIERSLIEAALARTRGNRVQAAKLLGLSREGLRIKMARMEIDT